LLSRSNHDFTAQTAQSGADGADKPGAAGAVAAPAHWQAGRFDWPLGPAAPVLVMGIVNVTPDSFSDGGQHSSPQAAIRHGQQLAAEGAHILDVGGESTRPGAPEVGVDDELRRVLPVVQALAGLGHCVSIDTRKPEVMRAALAAGASIVNDVMALTAPGAAEVCAASDAGVVLMHMRGEPRSMQAAPHYDDVVAEVAGYLVQRADACVAAGIARERIALDPGFGFGKTPEHNLVLTRGLAAITALGYPVLAGWSRKSTLGAITGRTVAHERVAASVAAALACVARGARIVRVHDVAATVDALKVWAKLGV